MFQTFIPMSVVLSELLSKTLPDNMRERLKAEYDEYCAKYQELFGSDDEPCTATAPFLPSMLTADSEAMSFGKRRLTFEEYVEWDMYRVAEFLFKHVFNPRPEIDTEKLEWLSKKIEKSDPRPNLEREWQSGPNLALPYQAFEWYETEQFNRGLFSQPVPKDLESKFHNQLLTDEPPQ